jgi:hypothetical protein
MYTGEWVIITDVDAEAERGYQTGAAVLSQHSKLREDGTRGVVVAWARGKDSHEHWTNQHVEGGAPSTTCPYERDCDALCDSEGPLVRWDNQDVGDESLDWFPGQAMACLRPATGQDVAQAGWS